MYNVIYALIHLLYSVHESAYHVTDNTFTLYITYTQLCYKNCISYNITQSNYKPHKTVFKKIVNYKITHSHATLYLI